MSSSTSAKQLGVGALQFLPLELLALGGRVAEAPAAVLGALAAARVLDDPVKRDELGDDQLAHGALLFWTACLAGRARGRFLGEPARAVPGSVAPGWREAHSGHEPVPPESTPAGR